MGEQQVPRDGDDGRAARRTRIRRPKRAASDEGRSRLGDLTRPVAREHAITRRLSSSLVFGLVATVIFLALAITLFVLPVRTWYDQGDKLDERQAQLTELQAINEKLQVEVDRLDTDAGVREAAREEVGMVEGNETRESMLDYPMLPKKLPKGWPYSIVTDIIAVRSGTGGQAPKDR